MKKQRCQQAGAERNEMYNQKGTEMYDESVHFDPNARGWWLVGKLTDWSSFQELYTGSEGCALGVAQFVRDRVCVQFREIDDILTGAGIPVDDGDEYLTGKHIHRETVVHESTTLRGPVSVEYCEIIERLFTAYPVGLQIGDPASFPHGHEPWHVVWLANDPNSPTHS
jgi:hypothetical protein